MDKIEKFNRTNAGVVANEAMEALAAVADKHDVVLHRERGSFDRGGASFTFKVTFKTVTESGEPADFKPIARMYGLPEDCWHAELDMPQGRCKIIGFNARAKRYPVLTEKMDGSRGYAYPASAIKQVLELERLRAQQAASA